MNGTARQPKKRWEARKLAALAAQGVADGTLALRHVVGLSDAEMSAIGAAAERLRKRGRLRESASVYGLLVAQDPLQARYWRSLADVQQQLGNHGMALTCYEVLALLEQRTADATRREAASLAAMGQKDLAGEIEAVALRLDGGVPLRAGHAGRRTRA